MGFEPHRLCSKLESVNEFAERMAQGLEEAKSAIAKVKLSMPCTTTTDESLPWSSNQETKSG
jgi:hypothetical protein